MGAPVPRPTREAPSPSIRPHRPSAFPTIHYPPPTTPRMLTPFPLITYIQAPYFHALTHSFAQRRHAIPFPFNALRTLSIATGVYPNGFASMPSPSLCCRLPPGSQTTCSQQLAASFARTPGVAGYLVCNSVNAWGAWYGWRWAYGARLLLLWRDGFCW
jgi:hypothetical protein